MSDRDRYRALMLEHLYGLLEPDEARELAAYLASPDGAELRAEAEQARDRITAAAKVEFPAVNFAPPADEPIPLKPAATPASRRSLTMAAVWTRWGVAASLLLVFVGLGGPALYQLGGWFIQSREVNHLRVAMETRRNDVRSLETQQQTRRDEVRREHGQAVAAHQAAEQAYRKALEDSRQALEEKDFVVRLTGPERAQPGAVNEWKIETLTRDNRHALPQKVEVVVKDQTDAELLRQTYTPATGGSPSLKLPPAFWEKVKPGSDLYLEVVAHTDDNRRSVLAERLPLARPVYVTYLVTDKPLYQPGETIRFRSLTLDRATFLPPDRDMNLEFRLRKPDGAVIPVGEGNGRVVGPGLTPLVGPDGKPLRGIGTGEHVLEDDAPLGEYVLELVELGGPNPDGTVLETRSFQVGKYVVEKFEKRLEFDGKSYGPGDTVQARIEVSRAEGGPIKDARAEVTVATGDGRSLHTDKGLRFDTAPGPNPKSPATAVASIRFQLPADLLANRRASDPPVEVTLTVAIKDGAHTEPIVRQVPLVENELKVEFLPEGGDLVEGVPGRVYFEVRTAAGKPADLKGVITDGQNTVAEVATLTDAEHPGVNRGQGVFTLTPRAGKNYFLKLRSPVGIKEPTRAGFPLPAAKPDGVVLTALDPITETGAPIRVRLQTAKGPKTLHLGAYARGRLVGQQRVEVTAGNPVEVKLVGDASLGGVARVTVFEEPAGQGGGRITLIPRAERLVYCKPAERLTLGATPNQERYAPTAKVALDLAAANEKGQPVPAVILVAVINQGVIAMADDRTDRLLPTHFLLAGEVRRPGDLEHADFLLTDHPKAAAALDLLLGTQGWRRFAEQNQPPTDPGDRPEVERMLVAHGNRAGVPVKQQQLAAQRLSAEFLPKIEQAALRAVDAQAAWEDFQKTVEPQFQLEMSSAKIQADQTEREYQHAAALLYEFETRDDRAENLRNWALPAFLIGLIALGVAAFAFAVSRQPGERRRYFATAGGAFAAAVLVIGSIVLTQGTPENEQAYLIVQNERNRSSQTYGPIGPVAKGMTPLPGPGPRTKQGEPDQVPVKEKVPTPPVRVGTEDESGKGLVPVRGNRPNAGTKTKTASSDLDADAERLAKLEAERRKLLAAGAPKTPRTVNPPPKAADAEPALPFIVREYPHRRDAALGPMGSDLTETVYWHPVLVLPDSGRAKVEFQLSDAVGRYRVLISGHTVDGRVGATIGTIDALTPASADAGRK
ncbi:MAG TPA: hypothetical protein VKD90_30790 [Gemmataceae bacterium]|nr:hypothetical protein [Gemmataceae bacterium]